MKSRVAPQIRAGGVHALREEEGGAAAHDDEGHGPRREGGACFVCVDVGCEGGGGCC